MGLRTELILQQTVSNDVTVDLPDIGVHLTYSCQSLADVFSLPLCKHSSLLIAVSTMLSPVIDM